MIDYDMIRIRGDVDVNLSLHDVQPTDSYIFREADGITAPEFNTQIKNTLYQGGVFQNRQPLNKQVVLSIRLNPNYGAGETVRSLRQNLYKMLSPRWNRALKVQLVLAGSVVAELEGHVSGMPMNPFTKEPEVQVAIDCLSACWFAPTLTNYLPISPTGLELDYVGSAPIGFAMDVRLNKNVTAFEIFNNDNSLEKIRINFRFNTYDIVTVDTRPGTRSVSLTRSGITRSLLFAMSKDSKWIELYEGLNSFSMIAGPYFGGSNGGIIPDPNPTINNFEWLGMYYTPQWWGA